MNIFEYKYLECKEKECSGWTECSKKVYYCIQPENVKNVDVLFTTTAYINDSKPFNTESINSVCKIASQTFLNALNYVEKEIGQTKSKAFSCFVGYDGGKGNEECWPYCKFNFLRIVKTVNPKLIVTIGPGASSALLTDQSKEVKIFSSVKNIFTEIELEKGSGKKYKILPIPGTSKVADDPSLLCGVVDGLRRALKFYDFKPIEASGKEDVDILDRCPSITEIEEVINNKERRPIWVIPKTVKEVKRVIYHLATKKTAIALDTETINTNRRYANKLLSIQFCYDPKIAFLIYVNHSRFLYETNEERPSEDPLILVKNYLHHLFTTKHKDLYWIAHNAKFDIQIIYSLLGKAFIVDPVICTMTFPFILEENYIDSLAGGYGLKELASKYGFHGYKAQATSHRSAGKLEDLPTADFEEYAITDAVVTIQLYNILKQIAMKQPARIKYPYTIKTKQVPQKGYLNKAFALLEYFYSRVYKLLAIMEYNGIVIDRENLDNLQLKSSDLNQAMENILTKELPSLESVKETNKLLIESSSESPILFPIDDIWVFDLNKTAHRWLLFFYTLGLKPLSLPKTQCPKCKGIQSEKCTRCKGTGRNPIFNNDRGEVTIAGKSFKIGPINKAFQTAYRKKDDKPPRDAREEEQQQIIEYLIQYNGYKKLLTSYVKAIEKFLDRDSKDKEKYRDYNTDQRVRPQFSLMAKTGRARTKEPNSQQIPRGDDPVKKAIKDIFYSPPGYAIVSLDYMAVEVRTWGIISGDVEMKRMFIKAAEARARWKKGDVKAKQEAIEYGDIHIANASAMYNVRPNEVKKHMRQASKNLTFGSIFGRSLRSMALEMKCSEDEASIRRDRAFSKFKQAGKWLDNIQIEAEKNFFIESPLGRRRRFWEFLIPKELGFYWWARAGRQSRNSPIQGFASDLTFLAAATMLQELIIKENKDWQYYNAVHDAIYLYVPIDEVEECVLKSENFFTTKLFDMIAKEFNFRPPFPLEAEFEIGLYSGSLTKWDFSPAHLKKIIEDVRVADKKRQKEASEAYIFKGF